MKLNRLRAPGGLLSPAGVTDCYCITMLGAFPLFPGFEGYANITWSKFLFFAAATGLWLLALAAALLRERGRGTGRGRRPAPAEWAGLAFLAALVLSWLCSPWRAASLLGAGRWDGLLSCALYALCFLGAARYAEPKPVHAAALAVGTGLCCLVAVGQLFGLDPLRLYPSNYCYYDTGLRYSGAYLGTIGNTNILDALLALALPLFAALWIEGRGPLWLLPLVPGLFVVLRAGGGGVKAALLVAALVGMPLLLRDLPRVRRGLRLGALGCGVAALALAFAPTYQNWVLRLSFAFSRSVLLALVLGALLLGLSFAPTGGRKPKPETLRRLFLGLDAALLILGAVLVWNWKGESGTLWELRQVLRGELSDEFGSSRVLIWRECLALVRERPLLGGGPGTLPLRLDIRFSRYVSETGRTLASYVDNAHNVYLGTLVNCGAVALAAELGMLVLALRGAFRDRDRAALATALAGALVHGLFGLGLCISEPVFWLALGLTAARNAHER